MAGLLGIDTDRTISLTFVIGAALAAVAGLIETFWSAYFSVEYKDVAAFSILVVALIFMPSGILRGAEVEKV